MSTSPLRTRQTSPFSLSRPKGEDSVKLIFISCEGAVTEEIYFGDIISQMLNNTRSKIKIASARADFFSSVPVQRTQIDIDEQNKSTPRQVMERLDNYLSRHKYWDSVKNPDDEFWLILDIDDHTSIHKIDEWNKVLTEAKTKNYQYAVSNPFFEFGLLLHHVDVTDEDRTYAVTATQDYQKTKHFTKRLKDDAHAPLIGSGSDKKIPKSEDYTMQKIKDAIERAKKLHTDPNELWPHNLGSTVYILLEKIIGLLPE